MAFLLANFCKNHAISLNIFKIFVIWCTDGRVIMMLSQQIFNIAVTRTYCNIHKRMNLWKTKIYLSEDLTMNRSKLLYKTRIYTKSLKWANYMDDRRQDLHEGCRKLRTTCNIYFHRFEASRQERWMKIWVTLTKKTFVISINTHEKNNSELFAIYFGHDIGTTFSALTGSTPVDQRA